MDTFMHRGEQGQTRQSSRLAIERSLPSGGGRGLSGRCPNWC